MHTSGGVQEDLLFTNLSDLASVDHVAHELSSTSIAFSTVLSVFDLASQGGQLPHISSHLLLSLGFHQLLFFYLTLGPSSLAADLEHISPDALGH